MFIDKTYKTNGLLDLSYKGRPLERFKDSSIYLDAINTLREANIEIPEQFKHAIARYEETLEREHYFDYTSILTRTMRLIETNQKVRELISDKYKYLIVDEYQDVNPIQEKLIKILYDLGINICVVGDDDQTIYHWRGSKINNIITFSQRYDNVKKIELLENFRSSEGIVKSAESVIRHNRNRLNKTMISANMQRYDKYDIIGKSFEDQKEEIDFIINKIKQLEGIKFDDKEVSRGLSHNDMAILVYSVKKIPRYLLEQLSNNNIDFVVEGMKNLFEKPEILASNNIFNYFASSCSKSELIDSWLNIEISINQEMLVSAISALDKRKPNNCETWEDFNLQDIYKEFLLNIDIFNINNEKIEKILYNVAKYTQVIDDYETVHMKTSPEFKAVSFSLFLTYNAADYYPEGWLSPNFGDSKGLKIMTFFQAKGLQFPVVFMPFLTKSYMFPPSHGGKDKWGIIGNLIDSASFKNSDEDLRRLFYVGVTRSKKYLLMSNSPHYTEKRCYKKIADSFAEILHSNYVNQNELYDFCDRERAEIREIDSINNITFDFTTLKEFYECPAKFKYSHVYGFRQPMDYRMGFGKSIHNILTEIHKVYMVGEQITKSKVDEIVDRHFYLPYAPPKLKEDMKSRARKDVDYYLENNFSTFDEIIYVEKKIEFNLGNSIFIQGRVDLVKNTKTGQTKIIDFKSNKSALGGTIEREQLLIYALGYYHLTGEHVNVIEAYHMDERLPYRYEINEIDLKNAQNKIESAANCINKNTFHKINSIVNGCDKCKSMDCPYDTTCNKRS